MKEEKAGRSTYKKFGMLPGGRNSEQKAAYSDYRAASLAVVTCRVKVPMMEDFPFAHLA